MRAVELMMAEHENIIRMLKVTRAYCYKFIKGEAVDIEDLTKIIDFVRNYADKHHHAKEEDILFAKMSEQLGERIKNGPIMGMLVEHDMGRLYIQGLEDAIIAFKAGDDEARLDIVANAVSYANLLARHIDKENTAIYTFANNALTPENKEIVDRESDAVENKAIEQGFQTKYIEMLEELERKLKK